MGLTCNVVIRGWVRRRKPFEDVLFYLCPWRRFSLDGGHHMSRGSQTFHLLYVALYLPYIALYVHHVALNFLDIVQYLLHGYVGFIGN